MLKKISIILSTLTLCAVASGCDDGSKSHDPECVDQTKMCSEDGTVMLCQNGSWNKQDACAAGSECRDGNCVETCQNGAKRCSASGLPQICNNNLWNSLSACENGTCQDGNCVPNKTTGDQDDQGGQGDQGGQDKPGDDQPTQSKVCEPASCESAISYKGNVCVDVAGKNEKTCGCNANSDCKSGYKCEDHVCEFQCSNATCAAKTTGYEGDLCITETEEDETLVFCGCDSDENCRSGYFCDLNMRQCLEGCDETECKKMTTDYSGDICIVYRDEYDEGYDFCGCHSDKDCREGYQCNTEFNFCSKKDVETAGCQAEKCAAVSDDKYVGSACVVLSGGIGCGCESDDDCRGDFVCDYKNTCIIEEDISECKVDDDCKKKTGNNYYGDICIPNVYEYGINYYCGCTKNSECKSGYFCDREQETCMKNEEQGVCDELECVVAPAGSYYGDVCVDWNGYNVCGCDDSSDCRAGYTCNPSKKACE